MASRPPTHTASGEATGRAPRVGEGGSAGVPIYLPLHGRFVIPPPITQYRHPPSQYQRDTPTPPVNNEDPQALQTRPGQSRNRRSEAYEGPPAPPAESEAGASACNWHSKPESLQKGFEHAGTRVVMVVQGRAAINPEAACVSPASLRPSLR